MRLMRRVRDGKVAVYDQGCIDSGRWEAVAASPEPQTAPEPKPAKAPPWLTKPKATRPPPAPLPPPPPPPPLPPTDAKAVLSLFKPALTETEAQTP